MAVSEPVVAPQGSEDEPTPLLAEGMRLTRTEFHRRYGLLPEIRGAELIDGVVHMPSPIRIGQHARPQRLLLAWLFQYERATPGVESVGNATVLLGDTTEVEPDGLLWVRPDSGGRLTETPDDYLEGVPELVVEVAARSAKRDLSTKRRAYERAGVQECLIALPGEGRVLWLALEAGTYHPLEADQEGLFVSRTFPGLWLDAAALLAGDVEALSAALERGLATAEHARFVAALRSRHPRP